MSDNLLEVNSITKNFGGVKALSEVSLFVKRGEVLALAGDNAAGAIGAGVVASGQGLLSLGTSGVFLLAGDQFSPNPSTAAHAFCHAVPEAWVQTAVLLSAASCLSWVAGATGGASEAALLDELAEQGSKTPLLFLPYLSGERTP